MLTKPELISQLISLNSPEMPFQIKEENGQVKATWNIVDAQWLQIFAKAGMKKTYEITLTLDEAKHEVSYNERTGTVEWVGGVPQISFAAQAFSGKTKSFSFGKAYGMKTDGTVGELYNFDFNTSRIKDPIFAVVQQAGWTVKRSFLEKLLGM